MNPNDLAAAVGASIGARLQPGPAKRLHGGSINECFRWEGTSGSVFVKLGNAGALPMFEAEAAGLEQLRRADAVRIPQVLAVCGDADSSWLALEWISFTLPSAASKAALGKQLAQMHRVSSDGFGWHRDNTIGSTPQINTWTANWVTFLREQRLRRQLDLARRNGYDGELQHKGETLLNHLEEFFGTHTVVPSLLHGDLWGGNWAVDQQGMPVLFDPAVYFGDREADLAMTHLFGGFGAEFYAAYMQEWPLPKDAQARVLLYNLYHILNHLNLFGSGYLQQALDSLRRLLAQAGH